MCVVRLIGFEVHVNGRGYNEEMGGGKEGGTSREGQGQQHQQQQRRQSVIAADMGWQWEEDSMAAADLTRRRHMPIVVKLDGEDYGNFGTGTQLDVDQPFLLYTVRRCSKVLAASILWDERQQQYEDIGPTLVIPVNYPGKLTTLLKIRT